MTITFGRMEPGDGPGDAAQQRASAWAPAQLSRDERFRLQKGIGSASDWHGLGVTRHVRIDRGRRALAVRAIEELHPAARDQQDLGGEAVGVLARLLPAPGLQLAVDVDQPALHRVPFEHVDQPVLEGHDPVPLGAVDLLAGLADIGLVGRDAQVGHAAPRGEVVDGDVGAEAADQFHAVQSEGHDDLLMGASFDDGLRTTGGRVDLSPQPLSVHPQLASLSLRAECRTCPVGRCQHFARGTGRRPHLGEQLRNAVGAFAFLDGDEAFYDEETRFGAGEHGLGSLQKGGSDVPGEGTSLSPHGPLPAPRSPVLRCVRLCASRFTGMGAAQIARRCNVARNAGEPPGVRDSARKQHCRDASSAGLEDNADRMRVSAEAASKDEASS